MSTPVKLPNLGESVTHGIINAWLKNDGDAVKKDEPICTIESDKANADVSSPVAGVLRTTRKVGDSVPVGEVIANIDEVGSAAATTPSIASPAGSASASASGPGSLAVMIMIATWFFFDGLGDSQMNSVTSSLHFQPSGKLNER